MGENKLARNSSLNSLHMEIMVIWRMYRQVWGHRLGGGISRLRLLFLIFFLSQERVHGMQALPAENLVSELDSTTTQLFSL
jgi:hypothetical protein